MSKIPGLLLLPMPLILLLMIGVFIGLRRRLGVWLVTVSASLLLLLSLPITGKLAQRVLSLGLSPLHELSVGPFDAVVVPLGGLFQDSTGAWWPKRRSITRAVRGWTLARQFYVPLILSGGSTKQNSPSEAEVTRGFLRQHMSALAAGVEIDPNALNSAGTAHYVARRAYGWNDRRIVLVTSESHMPRMTATLRRIGVSVCAVPVSISNEIEWGDLVPSARGYSHARRAAREYAAIAWYYWNDWLHLENLFARRSGEEACAMGNGTAGS